MRGVARTWHTASRARLSRLPGSSASSSGLLQRVSTNCSSNARNYYPATALYKLAQRREHSIWGNTDLSTIYALSTAPGRAAIAIIRVSGPACRGIYRSLCPDKDIPKPRYATLRTLYEPNSSRRPDAILDSYALVFFYPAPSTVTGEDVLELHVHGGPAVVKAVLAAIPQCDIDSGSVRYAEPGEFTRRAFMNDRLDLTQIEALGDILNATTEQQRRLSVRGTTNTLVKRYEAWRQQLLYARGELEALIDFSEDQHFDESPGELCASVSKQVRILKQMLQAHSENAMRGELLRNGISLSLLGAPNAGKSSLLNCIIGREAAIVSQEAGTTRDVVEVGIDLGGYFCRIGDTAGLRKGNQNASPTKDFQHSIGLVEEEGMRRAKERAADSDVVLLVLSFEMVDGAVQLQFDPEVVSTAAELAKSKNNVIVAINKSDLPSDLASLDGAVRQVRGVFPGIEMERIFLVSCRDTVTDYMRLLRDGVQTDSGNIQVFLQGLTLYFASLTAAVAPDLVDGLGDSSVWQDSLGASERQRLLLLQCGSHLDAFLLEVESPSHTNGGEEAAEADIVVAAEHLRAAADCLARITGRGEAGDVEEVLGVVFEKFCVGK